MKRSSIKCQLKSNSNSSFIVVICGTPTPIYPFPHKELIQPEATATHWVPILCDRCQVISGRQMNSSHKTIERKVLLLLPSLLCASFEEEKETCYGPVTRFSCSETGFKLWHSCSILVSSLHVEGVGEINGFPCSTHSKAVRDMTNYLWVI